MKIQDLREHRGFNVWDLDTFDEYTEQDFFLDEVSVYTKYGYKITFGKCDLDMLRSVIALFEEHMDNTEVTSKED